MEKILFLQIDNKTLVEFNPLHLFSNIHYDHMLYYGVQANLQFLIYVLVIKLFMTDFIF